jgi:hypothetical protein
MDHALLIPPNNTRTGLFDQVWIEAPVENKECRQRYLLTDMPSRMYRNRADTIQTSISWAFLFPIFTWGLTLTAGTRLEASRFSTTYQTSALVHHMPALSLKLFDRWPTSAASTCVTHTTAPTPAPACYSLPPTTSKLGDRTRLHARITFSTNRRSKGSQLAVPAAPICAINMRCVNTSACLHDDVRINASMTYQASTEG